MVKKSSRDARGASDNGDPVLVSDNERESLGDEIFAR